MRTSLAVVVMGAWLSSTAEVSAYIDPGSSSYLFQILIGGLTAVAFFFGSIRRRLGLLWHRLFNRRSGEQSPSAQPPAPAPAPSRDA